MKTRMNKVVGRKAAAIARKVINKALKQQAKKLKQPIANKLSKARRNVSATAKLKKEAEALKKKRLKLLDLEISSCADGINIIESEVSYFQEMIQKIAFHHNIKKRLCEKKEKLLKMKRKMKAAAK